MPLGLYKLRPEAFFYWKSKICSGLQFFLRGERHLSFEHIRYRYCTFMPPCLPIQCICPTCYRIGQIIPTLSIGQHKCVPASLLVTAEAHAPYLLSHWPNYSQPLFLLARITFFLPPKSLQLRRMRQTCVLNFSLAKLSP